MELEGIAGGDGDGCRLWAFLVVVLGNRVGGLRGRESGEIPVYNGWSFSSSLRVAEQVVRSRYRNIVGR